MVKYAMIIIHNDYEILLAISNIHFVRFILYISVASKKQDETVFKQMTFGTRKFWNNAYHSDLWKKIIHILPIPARQQRTVGKA